MTQQHYVSEAIVCEDFIDIRALTSMVIEIGSLERVSAISDEHSITYRYSSIDNDAVNELHEKWNHYLNTGYY